VFSLKQSLNIAITALLFIVAYSTASATTVSQAAVLFLRISPSTVANGMGQTYSPLSFSDSFQNYFFPGSSIEHGVSLTNGFKVDWLPSWGFDDLYYDMEAYQVGLPMNCPGVNSLLFSFSFYSILFDMGAQPWTDENGNTMGTIESWDRARALRFGISWREQWQRNWLNQTTLNAGWGLDFVYSNLATGVQVGSQVAHAGQATCWDWGLSATSRILQSSDGNVSLDLGMQVAENFISNQDIYYVDVAHADPLPRTASWSLACAVEWRLDTLPLGRVHIAWGRDIILLDENGDYKPFLSSITNGGDVSHIGREFTVADIITWRTGIFDEDWRNSGITTRGWGVQTLGIRSYLDYLPELQQNRYLNLFLTRFNLFYNYSSWDGKHHAFSGTVYQEIGISFGQ